MDIGHNKNENPKQQMAEESGIAGTTAQSILDGGTEVYWQAEQAVGDVYDKTAQAVSETYEQAKGYGSENPGKTILIALGIGVGLGFLLGASSRGSRNGRFGKPVVHVLSNIARAFFR